MLECSLEQRARRPQTTISMAGQRLDRHDLVIFKSGEGHWVVQARTVRQHECRRSANPKLVVTQLRLSQYCGAHLGISKVPFEAGHVQSRFLRNLKHHVAPADIAAFGEKGAPDPEIEVEQDIVPLAAGAVRRVEGRQRGRWPIVAGESVRESR